MRSTTLRAFVIIFTIITLFAFTYADLESDLRDFVPLIPRRRIGYIAARQFIIDQRFRNALTYIRSPEFPRTWQQIRNTTDFTEIVEYITNNGSSYDVTKIIDRIPNRLRSFQIPSKVPVEMMFQRNLSTFLSEAVRSLPRSRISNLMALKVKEGGDFAQLYEAVRKQEFREMVKNARNSPSLAAPLKKLNQNSIDVDNLVEIGFSVLNWGP